MLSYITRVTVQSVSAEPLVNFFTRQSFAISCPLFNEDLLLWYVSPTFEAAVFLSSNSVHQPGKQEERPEDARLTQQVGLPIFPITLLAIHQKLS